MGYSRDSQGRLCCDVCGQSGGVRKRRCPVNYCPALAACADCWQRVRADRRWQESHKDCPTRSAAYHAHLAREAALLASGAYVRCSAMGNWRKDNGKTVRVIFKNAARESVGFDMADTTYDALPGIEAYTPDDYRKHGELTPALPDFADCYELPREGAA